MSESTPAAKLVITADDWGYWPSYNQGILEAIDRGMIDSVSAMVEREYCSRDPLLERGVEVGLHLEFEGRWGSRSGNAARRALEVQLDRFSRQFGFWPSYIDGHHHCHARPEMVSHVADLALQLGIPVRSVSAKHRQLLRERGILTQDHLIGRLSPDEDLPDQRGDVEAGARNDDLVHASRPPRPQVGLGLRRRQGGGPRAAAEDVPARPGGGPGLGRRGALHPRRGPRQARIRGRGRRGSRRRTKRQRSGPHRDRRPVLALRATGQRPARSRVARARAGPRR